MKRRSEKVLRTLLRTFLCLLGCLGAFSPPASAQTYVFGEAVYATNSGLTEVVSVATGDFNQDGRLDLALANWGCATQSRPAPQPAPCPVSILLGKPDGTFAPPVNYTVGIPLVVVTGDFNGDGRLDLAVANYDGTVAIWPGNGDGTFQVQSGFSAVSPGSFPSMVAGDFNRDGNLDLAVAVDYTNAVTILLGNGDGTFQPPAQYAAGGSALSLTAGDFNGDRKPDLAVATDHGVAVLLGNGDGTFQLPLPTPIAGTDLAVGDFNGDGKLDLAAASGGIMVAQGNGDGTFQTPVNLGVDATRFAVFDLNRDGQLDLVGIDSRNRHVGILLGNGDGTFQPARAAPFASLGSDCNYFFYSTFHFAFGPGGIAVGDFTGDGNFDLAIVYAPERN